MLHLGLSFLLPFSQANLDVAPASSRFCPAAPLMPTRGSQLVPGSQLSTPQGRILRARPQLQVGPPLPLDAPGAPPAPNTPKSKLSSRSSLAP